MAANRGIQARRTGRSRAYRRSFTVVVLNRSTRRFSSTRFDALPSRTKYDYDPYGERFVLDADFTDDSDGASDFGLKIGHQGLHHDPVTGLVYNRNRMLHTQLGRFMQRDPLGYVDGMSSYQYQTSRPTSSTDPQGTVTLKECLDACYSACKETAVARICRRLKSPRARALCWSAIYGSTAFCTGICYAIF